MNWIRSNAELALYVLGLGLLSLSIWLLFVSSKFSINTELLQRPVLSVVVVLIVASVLWLVASWFASLAAVASRRSMLYWIVGVGIASRIMLIFSTPILEIDLYRYLWDGNVMAETGDPYEYAPVEFVQGERLVEVLIIAARSDEETEWLSEFTASQDDSMKSTLAIMANHFGQFTSPYPPVSQAVFAFSHVSCPKGSSLKMRVVVLKAWLVLFDIATGFVLILILRQLKKPTTMSIVWFWSPLVLKEFANGGHLDSIAIFCTVTFAWFAINQLSDPKRRFRWTLGAGIFLALAVGAKIYPVVLAPLWAIATIRKLNLAGIASGIVSISLMLALLMPVLAKVHEYQNDKYGVQPVPGIVAFTESWEMNDFLFMLVVENLKPAVANASGELTSPWLVVVPQDWRSELDFQKAFSMARRITTLVFLVIVIWLLWRWWCFDESERQRAFLEYAFLTLAWFWLLSPTQNPWYWCWAMPFLAFARSRIWFLVGVTTLLYYARFWFDYHGHDIAGFDFVFPVVEFAPILLLLAATCLKNRLGKSQPTSQNGSPAKI
jgi:hypothetical protein